MLRVHPAAVCQGRSFAGFQFDRGARRLSVAALFFALGIFALPLPPLAAQGGAAPARTVSKFRDSLERKPYHTTGFDRMFEAAVSADLLTSVVESYESLIESDPANTSARIVLARLYGRTEQAKRALELLATVEGDEPEYHALHGSLLIADGQVDEGIAALERAAEGTTDRRALSALHRQRGEAYLRTNQREKAAEAFRTLSALEPRVFHTRLEVAAALSRNGLLTEAEEELSAALDLTGGDNAKHCRVLAELGRLHERKIEPKKALEVYHDGLERMARGNWLKNEFYSRILAIHRRENSLEQALTDAKAAVETNRQDLGAREFLADLYLETQRREDARAILEAAVADFPDDEALSPRLIAVLQLLQDTDAIVIEYQRQIERRPEDLELYIALGTMFARSEKLDQARRQWRKALERDIEDAALCARLAQLFVLFEMPEDAEGLLERAIEIEPREMRHYGDMIRFLTSAQPPRPVKPWLEKAEAVAVGSAALLEQASLLYRQVRDLEGTLRCLRAAVGEAPSDARLLTTLADLLLETDETDEALALYEQVIEHADSRGERTVALQRIVREITNAGVVESWIEKTRERVATEPEALTPHLVLAELLVRATDPRTAIEVYRETLAVHGPLEEVYESIARIYVDLGEPEAALETWNEVLEHFPRSRRKYLREIADVHLANYDQERALQIYQEILDGSPRNPAAFREIAKEYERLQYFEKSIECLQQVVRLEPSQARDRIALVSLLRHTGAFAEAEELLAEGLRIAEPEDRGELAGAYYETLAEQGTLKETMDRLADKIEENPYGTDAPRLLTELYLREFEYELALGTMNRLLDYQPQNPILLELRARVAMEMERYPEAIADHETLLKLPETDHAHAQLEIVRALVAMAKLDRARQIASTVDNPRGVAAVFRAEGLYDDAAQLIEAALAANPSDRSNYLRLTRIYEEGGNLQAAMETLERLIALEGDRMRTLRRLGDLYAREGKSEETIAIGKRMFDLLRVPEAEQPLDPEERSAGEASANRPTTQYFPGYWGRSPRDSGRWVQGLSEVTRWMQEKGFATEWGEILTSEAHRLIRNTTLYQQALNNLSWGPTADSEKRLELWEAAYRLASEEGFHPPTSTHEQWLESLRQSRVYLFNNDPEGAVAHAEKRKAELNENSTAEDHFLVAAFFVSARKDSEAIETLDSALEMFPDDPYLLLQRSTMHSQRKEHEKAFELLSKAAETPVELSPEERERRDFLTRRAEFLSMRQSLPWRDRGSIREEQLDRVRAAFASNIPGYGSEVYGMPLPRASLERRMIYSLFNLERDEEAIARLFALLDSLSATFTDEIWAAGMLMNNDHHEKAEPLFLSAQARIQALQEDESLQNLIAGRRYQISQLDGSLARLAEKKGEYREAYEGLRRTHQAGPALIVLKTHDVLEEVIEEYNGELETSLAAWHADDAPEKGTPESEELRESVRDSAVFLSDLLLAQKKMERAAAVIESVIPVLPKEFELLTIAAYYKEIQGDFDGAIELHRSAIEAKRQLPRRGPNSPAPLSDKIQFTRPPLPSSANDYRWSNLRRSSNRYSAMGMARSLNESPIENYAEILRIDLDRGKSRRPRSSYAASPAQTIGAFATSVGHSKTSSNGTGSRRRGFRSSRFSIDKTRATTATVCLSRKPSNAPRTSKKRSASPSDRGAKSGVDPRGTTTSDSSTS